MIAAIIVLYFPKSEALRLIVDSLLSQKAKIFVVDNTPCEKLAWLNADWFDGYGLDVCYLPQGDNLGIARAQNVGIYAAIQQGFEQFILFDQDSEPESNMIQNLQKTAKKLKENGVNLGAIGPIIYESKNGTYNDAIIYKAFGAEKVKVSPGFSGPVKSDSLIASGKLINIEVINKVGLMREDLFIDLVDTEWCIRAASKGFTHYMDPSAVLTHSIGDEAVDFMGKSVMKHSDVRKYYQIRNRCFLVCQGYMGYKWRTFGLKALLVKSWVMLWVSDNKCSTLLLLMRAWRDGLLARLGAIGSVR